MIDHVYLPVTDVARSRAFYGEVLRTLGIQESFAVGDSVGYGVGSPGAFWIYPAWGRTGLPDDPCGLDPEPDGALPRLHVAFRATTRSQVQEFARAAERRGAEVIRGPGVFAQYHGTYYGAFVRDPDDHDVEAVSHTPD